MSLRLIPTQYMLLISNGLVLTERIIRMLLKIDSSEKLDLVCVTVNVEETADHKEYESDTAQKAKLRRKLYERIAHRNALIEAEENAHRRWYRK